MLRKDKHEAPPSNNRHDEAGPGSGEGHNALSSKSSNSPRNENNNGLHVVVNPLMKAMNAAGRGATIGNVRPKIPQLATTADSASSSKYGKALIFESSSKKKGDEGQEEKEKSGSGESKVPKKEKSMRDVLGIKKIIKEKDDKEEKVKVRSWDLGTGEKLRKERDISLSAERATKAKTSSSGEIKKRSKKKDKKEKKVQEETDGDDDGDSDGEMCQETNPEENGEKRKVVSVKYGGEMTPNIYNTLLDARGNGNTRTGFPKSNIKISISSLDKEREREINMKRNVVRERKREYDGNDREEESSIKLKRLSSGALSARKEGTKKMYEDHRIDELLLSPRMKADGSIKPRFFFCIPISLFSLLFFVLISFHSLLGPILFHKFLHLHHVFRVC